MQEYQKRVVDEAKELKGRLDKLYDFIGSSMFTLLASDEQARLGAQEVAMRLYLDTLNARIAAF